MKYCLLLSCFVVVLLKAADLQLLHADTIYLLIYSISYEEQNCVFSSSANVYLMLCTNVSMTSKVHEGALWLYEHFCICGEDGVKSLEKTRRLALAVTSGRTNPFDEIGEK